MLKLVTTRQFRELFAVRRCALAVCGVVLATLIGEVSKLAAQEPGASDRLIALPAPRQDGATSVERTLTQRRSVRHLKGESLSLPEISQLVWAAQGVTEPIEDAPSIWRGSQWMGGLRTAPSAGGLYPLELYLVVGAVDDLEPGVYRYVPLEHALEHVGDGDRRQALAEAALMQSAIIDAPAVFVITAVYERTAVKYGERAERYVHIEVGAAGENTWLQAEALDLGSVFIGAFHDRDVQEVLGLPEDHQPLLIMPIGQKAEDWRERRGF
jgi:SagB-type dehydrogenase family enzyme